MAQVYRYPPEIERPELADYVGATTAADFDGYFQAMNQWEADLSTWARSLHAKPNDLIGYVYRHPVADGKAAYMVVRTKPLQLIELDDEYVLPEPHLRGLTVTDLRAAKKQDAARAKLFGPMRAGGVGA